jgi:glyoxylate reductase
MPSVALLAAPKRIIISNFAVGFGNIDINAAKKRNIVVTNTPDVLTDATAEIAILILLGAARRATEGIKAAHTKNWKWTADFLMGKQLTGSRLGILGMGRIGRAVAERARSFGMVIHYFNRSRLSKDLEKDAIYHNSLESLLSVSDFFSINCPAQTQVYDHRIVDGREAVTFLKRIKEMIEDPTRLLLEC